MSRLNEYLEMAVGPEARGTKKKQSYQAMLQEIEEIIDKIIKRSKKGENIAEDLKPRKFKIENLHEDDAIRLRNDIEKRYIKAGWEDAELVLGIDDARIYLSAR